MSKQKNGVFIDGNFAGDVEATSIDWTMELVKARLFNDGPSEEYVFNAMMRSCTLSPHLLTGERLPFVGGSSGLFQMNKPTAESFTKANKRWKRWKK